VDILVSHESGGCSGCDAPQSENAISWSGSRTVLDGFSRGIELEDGTVISDDATRGDGMLTRLRVLTAEKVVVTASNHPSFVSCSTCAKDYNVHTFWKGIAALHAAVLLFDDLT
jgi:hypothetical protein